MNYFDDSESNYNREDNYNQEKTDAMTELYGSILKTVGEDVDREGLLKTPKRAAKAMAFLTQGYGVDPVTLIEGAKFTEDYKQMIVVKDIEFYSLCEHHILPFFGKVHIAYFPKKNITGLSKLVRVVEAYARRLQVQERLTVQIHDCIKKALAPAGVAVVIEASHLCMQMRGVESPNSKTITSEYSGTFMENYKVREEFLALINKK